MTCSGEVQSYNLCRKKPSAYQVDAECEIPVRHANDIMPRHSVMLVHTGSQLESLISTLYDLLRRGKSTYLFGKNFTPGYVSTGSKYSETVIVAPETKSLEEGFSQ
jgi:hypothetical protein